MRLLSAEAAAWLLASLTFAIGALALVLSCAPSPVVPTPDATDASPCAVYERIDQARLIRLPDGGTFDVHCSDGAP